MNFKKGFTVLELLIVLAVIGVITAILMSASKNAIPDENIAKFKRVNMSFGAAIRELVTSGEYYLEGDLGVKPNGSLVDDAKYFCNTLSDVMSVRLVRCSNTNLGYNSSAVANFADALSDGIGGGKIYEYADCMCANNVPANADITLIDNTLIYIINPYYHFGSKTETGSAEEKRLFNPCSVQNRYKFLCIDIDGLNQGEAPFGYALRVDGKLIYGAKASAWMKASIQKNPAEEFTIPSLSSCSADTLTITPEDDSCSPTI